MLVSDHLIICLHVVCIFITRQGAFVHPAPLLADQGPSTSLPMCAPTPTTLAAALDENRALKAIIAAMSRRGHDSSAIDDSDGDSNGDGDGVALPRRATALPLEKNAPLLVAPLRGSMPASLASPDDASSSSSSSDRDATGHHAAGHAPAASSSSSSWLPLFPPLALPHFGVFQPSFGGAYQGLPAAPSSQGTTLPVSVSTTRPLPVPVPVPVPVPPSVGSGGQFASIRLPPTDTTHPYTTPTPTPTPTITTPTAAATSITPGSGAGAGTEPDAPMPLGPYIDDDASVNSWAGLPRAEIRQPAHNYHSE